MLVIAFQGFYDTMTFLVVSNFTLEFFYFLLPPENSLESPAWWYSEYKIAFLFLIYKY